MRTTANGAAFAAESNATGADATLGFCVDALVRFDAGAWIVSNPRTRHHVELDAAGIAAIARLAGGASEAQWREALEPARGWDRTVFAGAAGLWADQTGLGARARLVGGDELFALLRRRFFVVDGTAAYAEYLRPLTSLLDRGHLGTYHERVGQHVIADLRRANDWRWWHGQKFSPDGRSILDGPYKFVEEHFFDSYFGGRCAGARILDFACGNGHFSARFARYGAAVTGIDTSAELIELARRNHGSAAQFEAPSDADASLAAIEGVAPGRYDRVYMSDIVLLLLDDASTFDRLMRALHAALDVKGSLHIMEPNAAFWLAGRYGDPERPYAIIPEYRRPIYNVAPTLDRVLAAFVRNGFGLVELIHPTAAPAADAALRAFAAEYPLWDFCTFVRR
jgi:2-polyprenyl-3-methyl-5-hydroxy-6-metoxy-1,4-benzoquinol methylase